MDNRDPKTTPAAAGIDWAASGYSAAAKSLQVLAEEIAHISASSFEQNAKLIDDLRSARSVEDVFSIQTKFMAGMFETFNEHVRVMGSRMADLRNGVTEAGGNAAQAGVDAAQSAVEAVTQANIKAGEDLSQSTFAAAVKAADSFKTAAAQAAKTASDAMPVPGSKPSMQDAIETTTNIAQAGLKAGQDVTQSNFAAALKAADSIKTAANVVRSAFSPATSMSRSDVDDEE
jgi:hypothetical protein